jgi:K+-transporting ATPase ATPase C chain
MLAQMRAAVLSTLLLTLLLGIAYPLVVTGIGQAVFPAQANGSLLRNASGQVIGSRLIGQNFAGAGYLHPRPSAAGTDGYDASASSGSNLGPTNPALIDRVGKAAKAMSGPIAADALTTSASGLDPHVSPANARSQVDRIAAARGAEPADVARIIEAHVAKPALGFLGQPTVNVLETNLALDASLGRTKAPPQ